MKPRYKTGWITRAYEKLVFRLAELLFKTKLKHEFGVSFDNNISLNNLPVKYPNINDFYSLVHDVSYFEIIDTSVELELVYIRELATEKEYNINVELFDLLFSQIEKPIVSKF